MKTKDMEIESAGYCNGIHWYQKKNEPEYFYIGKGIDPKPTDRKVNESGMIELFGERIITVIDQLKKGRQNKITPRYPGGCLNEIQYYTKENTYYLGDYNNPLPTDRKVSIYEFNEIVHSNKYIPVHDFEKLKSLKLKDYEHEKEKYIKEKELLGKTPNLSEFSRGFWQRELDTSDNLKRQKIHYEWGWATIIDTPLIWAELEVYRQFVKKMISQKQQTPTAKKPQTLLDIWKSDSEGKKDSYERAISFLKEHNDTIDSPFVTEQEGKLTWLKTPSKGFAHYIAAFALICINKKWIPTDLSAPDLHKIFMKTFNIKFDDTPFKSLKGIRPDLKKYLKPFRALLDPGII